MKISIAYSPDTDDAFMIHALKEGKIRSSSYEWTFIAKEIQELNRACMTQSYDVCAISMAVYPLIAKDYWLLPVGASVGSNFGPVVVSRDYTSIHEIAHRRVAIAGKNTTANIVAHMLLPSFEAVFLPFEKIVDAVVNGDCDFGILIHEAQIQVEAYQLTKICDLGHEFYKAFKAPLPLGANVVKKSLGYDHAVDLLQLYRASITYALEHREEVLKKVLSVTGHGLDLTLAHRYIDMYVNRDSLSLSESCVRGMMKIFEWGQAHQYFDAIHAKEDFILLDK